MQIGDRSLEERVFIIAEIGNNHEGNFSLAEELVGRAAECGVDAVKFQTITPELFIGRKNKARFDRLKGFELTQGQFISLARLANSQGVQFMSTPFSIECVDYLSELVPAFKIASGDNNWWQLLDKVASTGKPIVISSGFTTLEDIKKSKLYIEDCWKSLRISQELAVLHCVSAYPVPPDQANLNAVVELREALKCIVGYSDHTIGIDAACTAVALGAKIIEKHFTIDKNYSDFRDHQLSADPADMKLMVEKIRLTSKLLGSGVKELQSAEREIMVASRRSIVAKRDLAAGTKIKLEDLYWMRPGDGLLPGQESLLVGKTLKLAVETGDKITFEMVS